MPNRRESLIAHDSHRMTLPIYMTPGIKRILYKSVGNFYGCHGHNSDQCRALTAEVIVYYPSRYRQSF